MHVRRLDRTVCGATKECLYCYNGIQYNKGHGETIGALHLARSATSCIARVVTSSYTCTTSCIARDFPTVFSAFYRSKLWRMQWCETFVNLPRAEIEFLEKKRRFCLGDQDSKIGSLFEAVEARYRVVAHASHLINVGLQPHDGRFDPSPQ